MTTTHLASGAAETLEVESCACVLLSFAQFVFTLLVLQVGVKVFSVHWFPFADTFKAGLKTEVLSPSFQRSGNLRTIDTSTVISVFIAITAMIHHHGSISTRI